MALLEGSLRSEALRMDTAVTVSLPQKMEEAERPVLYLLHGLGDDHTAWVRRSNIDRYANREGIAVIMPEVQRGFYTDMVYGPAYFTYITEELPRLCASLFRVTEDPARTYIAGLSMGGYGALKAALRRPERYAAAGCFSGAVDIRARMKAEDSPMTPGEIQAISGSGKSTLIKAAMGLLGPERPAVPAVYPGMTRPAGDHPRVKGCRWVWRRLSPTGCVRIPWTISSASSI